MDATTTRRVSLFGIDIDALNMDEAVTQMLHWVESPTAACRYVVTPNVDHAVMYQEREDLRRAYECAALVVADGIPLVIASRLLGKRLPERVAGSDVIPGLFDRCESAARNLRVYLLGAAAGVAERAADHIQSRWPHVGVVGLYSPPMGFERDEEENGRILAKIEAAGPDLLIIGLGAPKQELWVHQHHESLRATVAICAGATIDFLAGEKRRAPVWMRKAGLEWLYRVILEPRRLAGRYLKDAWIFPRLVWRDLVDKQT